MLRFLKSFLGILCLLVGALVMFVITIVGLSQHNIPATCVGIVIGIIFILLGILLIRKTKKEKMRADEKAKENYNKLVEINKELSLKPGTKQRIQFLGAELCISAKHMDGLPVAEGADMYLYLCDDKMIFERNENRYNLEFSKLRDVTIKTDEEIQKAYVSSVGGAIAGQMLFGTLGAIVGGRAKEKTTKTIISYLIFTYDKDGKNEFISFDVTNIPNAINFVTHFSENHSIEKREINL